MNKVIFLALLASTAACRPTQQTTAQSSAVLDVRLNGDGKTMDNAAALELLRSKYTGPRSRDGFYDRILADSDFIFQTGYNSTYAGSGSTMHVMAKSVGDQKVYQRVGEAEMFSTNGMGMFPPSKYSDIATSIVGPIFDAMERSLEGKGGYDKIAASDEGVSGTLTDRQIKVGSCDLTLKFASSTTNFKGHATFCEGSIVVRAESGEYGAPSTSGFVIEPKEG